MATSPITDITTPFNRLKSVLDAASEDALKASKGNHAAAVRVRKVMQQVKAQAQDIRVALTAPK